MSDPSKRLSFTVDCTRSLAERELAYANRVRAEEGLDPLSMSDLMEYVQEGLQDTLYQLLKDYGMEAIDR